MSERFIDLHSHSNASDGADSPTLLARNAAEAGLAAFALTDHDSVAGLEEAGAEAARLGLEFIPGVEIAVRHDFDELHLLGLWLTRPSDSLHAALAAFRQARQDRNAAILGKLAALGLPLSMEEVRELAGGEAVGRPHIAAALESRGYVRSRQEAFARYLGWGARAYTPRKLPTPAEGLALLRAEGATTVLAHPCLAPDMNSRRLHALLGTLKKQGLNAVEAWHSAHDPNQTRYCLDIVKAHGLLPSGGSDYHGRNKHGVALGVGRGNLRVPYRVLEALRGQRESRDAKENPCDGAG